MIFSIVHEKFAASVVEALFDLSPGYLVLFFKFLKNGGGESEVQHALIVYTTSAHVKSSSQPPPALPLHAIEQARRIRARVT